MSMIKELEIRGIRNFGDENARAKIRLSKPLTLILGPNGTGKTTIIEALKYVTSGEYPPDSEKGKSFVHEPKLTEGHTVRGKVKARIINKNGSELTISRTVQVTRQSSGQLKLQNIDNTLSRKDKDGNPVTITNRCTDVNYNLLSHMGVSKAILNYVIFCHQEESTWPLEDGKKLKDKFDEIFDTSSYNKAMDSTAKFVKELNDEIKFTRSESQVHKNLVEEVETYEKNLKNAERKKEENESRLNEIVKLLDPIEGRRDEITNTIKKYSKTERDLDAFKTQKRIITDNIDTLKSHIKKIFTGTKEELEEKITNFDIGLSSQSFNLNELEDELSKKKRMESNLSKDLADVRIKLGGLAQKKSALEERIAKRNLILKEALHSWDEPNPPSMLTENEVQSYLEDLNEKLRNFQTAMQKKIEEYDKEERHVQREVDDCRTEKTSIESERTVKSKEKALIRQEVNSLRKEISQTGTDAEKLNSIESKLQRVSKKYDDLVQMFDEENIKQSLQKKINERKDLDKKVRELEEEINVLHRQSSEQKELEITIQRMKEKKEELVNIKKNHEKDLTFVFDGDVPEGKIKTKLDSVFKLLTNEQTSLMKEIDQVQKKVTTLETSLKYNTMEIEKTSSELNELKDKLKTACDGDDFDETLKLQHRKVKSLNDQRGILANQTLMYEEYLENLKKQSCCPLCDRGFKNNMEQETLRRKLKVAIESNPEALKKCEMDLKREQSKYDSLQQLKPIVTRIADLEVEKLPKLQRTKEKYEQELDDTKETLSDLRFSLSEPEQKLKVCKSLSGDMAIHDNSVNEFEYLNQTLCSQKKQMSRSGISSDKTIAELQEEKSALQELLRSVQNDTDEIQSTLEKNRNEIQAAREEKNNCNEEVLKIRSNMQKLKQLKDKVSDLCTKEDQLEEQIHSLGVKLVTADSQLTVMLKDLTVLKNQNRKEQDNDQEIKMKASEKLRELESVQRDVMNFLNSNIDGHLKKTEEKLESISVQEEKVKTEISELDKQIRLLQEEVTGQEVRKKELLNNLELLRKEEKAQELKKEIRELESSLQDFNMKEMEREYRKLQGKKEDLEAERAMIKGKKCELEETIREITRNVLSQDKYKTARRNYKKSRIQIVVIQEAIKNLNTYMQVLDKAMIQYHTERMRTVNTIMKKLWESIYSGGDTSSIKIDVKVTSLGEKRRSYNYKLMQVKRGVEMDMKGRCSAGQKILASIIIRIALAETFCGNCAILALDEPTTNLDKDHAKKLADTLARIIKLRDMHKTNFQLLVISHDEEFITALYSMSGRRFYHELYRSDQGLTNIRQKDMSSHEALQIESSSSEEESEEEDEQSAQQDNSRKRALESSPPRPEVRKKRMFD